MTVLASGDPAIAARVKARLAQALRDNGLKVVSGGNPSHVIVQANLDFVGERQLKFYGKTETQTIWLLVVEASVAADQRDLGTGWTTEIQHTSLNLDIQVTTAVQTVGSDLARAIDDGWNDYRQSLGPAP